MARTAPTISFASASLTCRFDGAKIMPTKSAPAATATAAASAVTPHTLQSGDGAARPRSSAMSAAGDGAHERLADENGARAGARERERVVARADAGEREELDARRGRHHRREPPPPSPCRP